MGRMLPIHSCHPACRPRPPPTRTPPRICESSRVRAFLPWFLRLPGAAPRRRDTARTTRVHAMARVAALISVVAALFVPSAVAVTATPSPYVAVPFQASSVAVVRLGDASYNAATATVGFAMPVYVDEISTTTGALVRSVPLPMSSCTLGTGQNSAPPYWNYDTDGFPQLSDNGQVSQCHAQESVSNQSIVGDQVVAPPPLPPPRTTLIVRSTFCLFVSRPRR